MFLYWLEVYLESEFFQKIIIFQILRIGTPIVPGLALNEAKRNYNIIDMQNWVEWWGLEFTFNSNFPIRTVLPLRINIIEPKTFHLFFKAAWSKNINIGDKNIVLKLLNDAGFDGKSLIEKAQENEIKERLSLNNVRAKEEGLCGVPTFQINDKEFVWGQDKLNILADLLCGWNASEINAKL